MVFWRLPLQGHMIFFLSWYFHPEHHFSQSPVDLLVPQSVGDRVQQWSHHHVHRGSLLVAVQPVHLLLFHIYKHTAAVRQRKDNEVRRAGGESFLLLLGWWESNNCDDYVLHAVILWWGESKGHTKQGQGAVFQQTCCQSRRDGSGSEVTEEVRYDMGATEA